MKMKRIFLYLLAAVLILLPAVCGAVGSEGSGVTDTSGHLYCGAAKRNVDPPKDLLPKLFGVMPGTHFEEIVGGLYVRVIAIGNGKTTLLFIDYEMDQAPFPTETLKKIHEKYGIPEENIFLLGNHSHEVPVTGIRLAEPGHNQQREEPEYHKATVAYENIVLKGVYDALDEAISTMRPARIGYGSGESFINEHREMNYPSIMPIDRTLFIMRVEDLEGNPIAFLLNYSSHNNCVKSSTVVTADMEGCISHLMEDHFKGSIAIWSLSAHGDLMARSDYWNVPVHIPAPAFAAPETAQNEDFRRMRILSLRQFEDALLILSRIECKDEPGAIISGTVEFVDVPTYPMVENKDGSISYMGGAVTMSADMRKKADKRTAEAIKQGLSEQALPYRIRMHLTRLGNLAFVGVGGKLYNSYKLKIREVAPLNMETVVFGEDSSELSTVTYIFDDRALMESAEKGPSGGNSSLVKPGSIAEGIVKTTKDMFEKIGFNGH